METEIARTKIIKSNDVDSMSVEELRAAFHAIQRVIDEASGKEEEELSS